MRTHLIFAFGSNLDLAQMQARCPSAKVVGLATLPKHTLVFAGSSTLWNGAVAHVVRDPYGAVPGVLYRVSAQDLEVLDLFEGHPLKYRRRIRVVRDRRRRRRRAHVYILTAPRAKPGAPSLEYLTQIVRAYRRLGFDHGPLLSAVREVA
ncbi:MAG: gamma-glutamylcyclotransferase [Sandaracinaceae bacterium]|nr:gamma-glutamylcyclotransferase [Sandaracinaceae bacterium]